MIKALRIVVLFVCGLLCCASVLGWWQSHRTTDLVAWSDPRGNYYEIVTIPGQFRFTHVSGWDGKLAPRCIHGSPPPWWPVFGQQLVKQTWLPIGVGFEDGTRRINSPILGPQNYAPLTVSYQITAVPFALPALITGAIALWPILRLRRSKRLRAHRASRGVCPACGYDWRATPGACPECGHRAET